MLKKKGFDPTLYLVTHRENMDIDNFKRIIDEAIHGGVTTIQLREKDIDMDEFVWIGTEVKDFIADHDVNLIINDHPEVAKAIKADGVHLGQSDVSVEKARKFLGRDAIIGLSVENMEQAEIAMRQPLDYISISPIFSTPTKLDTASPWGIEGAKALRKKYDGRLLAIGGINKKNVEEVLNTGIDGVCVVSAIFFSKNPKLAAKKLKQKMFKKDEELQEDLEYSWF